MTNDPQLSDAVTQPLNPYQLALVAAGFPPTGVPINPPSVQQSNSQSGKEIGPKEVLCGEAREAGSISAESLRLVQARVTLQTNEMQSHFILGIRPRVPPVV